MRKWNYSKSQVYGIYGELGGGKTLTAVEMMMSALDQGHSVTTNIELRNLPSAYLARYQYIEDITTVDPWAFPCGAPRGTPCKARSIICVDEISENFDQYSGQASKNFLSWLRHSSKRGQTVIMISQRPEFMAKPLRLLVSIWVVCIDLAHWRIPMFRIRIPFMGGWVGRNMYDRNGNLISTGFNLASKLEIGYYYNTAQSIAVAGKQFDTSAETVQARYNYNLFFALLFLYLYIVLFVFGF